MIDWSNLHGQAEAAFSQHKTNMIDHFIRLRQIDQEVARQALASYVRIPNCPWPKIGDDVKTAWAAVVRAQKEEDEARAREEGKRSAAQ